MNLKEIAKDVLFGILAVGAIACTMAILIGFMKLVGLMDDTIKLMIAAPLFAYFCWAFGSLTRSILFKK
tara:strand:+ start:1459 stop:1665 length:207 start_codon:yes stop_codon:yes gene_type:complete